MFSNLAPGSYEFEVRAVSAAGERSPQPARAVFRVLPPVWRRWWFITLAALAVLGAVIGFEQYRAANRREISRAREERLAALEQVRRRIAADLHDEIGSTLTQISILSEVALQQGTRAMPELEPRADDDRGLVARADRRDERHRLGDQPGQGSSRRPDAAHATHGGRRVHRDQHHV